MSNTLNLREIKAAETAQPVPPSVVKRHPVVPREVTFKVEYDAPTGESFSSELTSKVLNGEGRILKTRVLSRLIGNINVDNVSPDELARLEALARASIQLVNAPEWVDEWCAQDNQLLAGINAVLVEHENRFFRGNSPEGQADARDARVRVASAFSSEAAAT